MVPSLFNTLTRKKEALAPLSPPRVGLYTCGPTVYNYQHIGNYRTYVFEDLLVRALSLLGFEVRRVMNITDVGHLTSQADEGEDKMEVGAAREGKTAWQVAEFYTKAFQEDCRELGLLPPDTLCKATDHIPEQVALIQRLEKKGLTYRISDGVYFDAARFPAYGRLMGDAHLEGLKAGARVEANPEKRGPSDFALWKFSPKGKKRDMEWDSPWGKGFPGWHIECSAMAMKYLGESFDIHCGGVDHIPIHHTNEIAQAEGATGKPFVKVWMHAEFLLMTGAKMAKSTGGFVTLRDLKAKGFHPLDYRYHCLTAHYRKQLDFSWDALESAKTSRRRLKESVLAVKGAAAKPACADHDKAFRAALADDLNAPAALAALWDCLRSPVPDGAKRSFVEAADAVLGLGLLESASVPALPAEVLALMGQRDDARRAKDFALSDKLRKQLEAKGFVVEDSKDGTKVRPR